MSQSMRNERGISPDGSVISRRRFIQYSAAGLAAVSSGGLVPAYSQSTPPMPTRILGKTGLDVSLLAFGGGSQFLRNEDGKWEPLLERAIEVGVNFFDTSSSYQWDANVSSEERFGEILPRYRDRIILSTKFDSRDSSGALREFEQSLKRMKTDYVDILMIHSIEPSDNISDLERGVYREMARLKEEGAVRYIGFSSMNSASKSREFIERLDLDVALLAMNPTGYGDFVKDTLPAAREKNLGVLAMKVMRDIVGEEARPAELLHYVWSQQGVASALVGHYGIDVLEENIGLARTFTRGSEGAMTSRAQKDLEDRLAHLAGPRTLCWARPDYHDGMIC